MMLVRGGPLLLGLRPRWALSTNGRNSLGLARRLIAQSVTDGVDWGRKEGELVHPDVEDLLVATKLSRLSEWCYKPDDVLQERLESEGFKLIGAGYTTFTRWYVAEGKVGADVIGETGRDSTVALTVADEAGVDRIVVVRGVVWRAKEVEVLKLWQGLSRFWPVPFADEWLPPACGLLAHAGVADMAQQLFPLMQNHMQGFNGRMYFTGHSLGGALAALLCCLHRVRWQGGPPVMCYTYGAPLVLTAANGLAKDGALQALGLSDHAFQHFVLNNDPIPAGMLATDLSLFFASQPSIRQVLDLQHQLFGRSVLPMLSDTIGQVHYIHWAQGRLRVSRLQQHELRDTLQPGMMNVMYDPVKALQAILDHHHAAYSAELRSAAQYLARERAQRDN